VLIGVRLHAAASGDAPWLPATGEQAQRPRGWCSGSGSWLAGSILGDDVDSLSRPMDAMLFLDMNGWTN